MCFLSIGFLKMYKENGLVKLDYIIDYSKEIVE